MNITFEQLLAGFAVIAALLLIAIETWLFFQRRQLRKVDQITQGFEQDCSKIVDELDSQAATQLNHIAPDVRVAPIDIGHLTLVETVRFDNAWKALQGRFDDNPKDAVAQADHLARELMRRLGYPVSDFEQRAEEISIDHPDVVANYRVAQAIAVRDAHGHADTEARRKAVEFYRALFDELLEVPKATPEEMPAEQMAIH